MVRRMCVRLASSRSGISPILRGMTSGHVIRRRETHLRHVLVVQTGARVLADDVHQRGGQPVRRDDLGPYVRVHYRMVHGASDVVEQRSRRHQGPVGVDAREHLLRHGVHRAAVDDDPALASGVLQELDALLIAGDRARQRSSPSRSGPPRGGLRGPRRGPSPR